MPSPRSIVLCILLLPYACANSALAQKEKQKTLVNYDDHIKPLLRQHCLKCHGNDRQEADLNLQNYTTLMKGGSGGQVVQAGRAPASLLLKAITNEDDDARMPPNSPRLAAAKIALIEKWINGGLRESASSKSLVSRRDFSFKPSSAASEKPTGPPAMPSNLPAISVKSTIRPLPVLSIATSPWAPLAAVAGYEHIKLFNTESSKQIGVLAYPEGEPHVIRFSRDGAVLMVAGGRPVESGSVVLFDVRTGKRLVNIGDEIDTVLAADLSPDQTMVVLGGSGRVVKVFSTVDGRQKFKMTKHTDWITAAAFSPDGSKLATSDRSGGIHLWDAKSGGILLNLAEHKASVRALAWRSDSKILASTGENGKIVWWDVTDGFPAITKTNAHPPKRPEGVFGRIPNGILAAGFDRSGNLATSGRDQRVRLWSPAGGDIGQFEINSAIPISVAVAHGGKKIICGDSRGEVHFFKIKK